MSETYYRRRLVMQTTSGTNVVGQYEYAPVEPGRLIDREKIDWDAAHREMMQQLRTGPHDAKAIVEAALGLEDDDGE